MAGGRPTKYKPEYPDLLRKHMEEGRSFETFAAQCRVSIETIYEWTRVHPEFSEAKKEGVALAMDWWEEKMRKNLTTFDNTKFNTTAWIYTMKCRFKEYWSEKQEVSHVIEDKREIKQLSNEELNKMLLEADEGIRN